MATSSMQSPGASGIGGGFLTAREARRRSTRGAPLARPLQACGAVETLLVVCQGLKVRFARLHAVAGD